MTTLTVNRASATVNHAVTVSAAVCVVPFKRMNNRTDERRYTSDVQLR